MAISGCGICGAGTTGAGVGAFPLVNSSQARLFLKDDGTHGDAAAIDPLTRDYTLDDRGIEQGTTSIQAKVQLALSTQPGNAVLGFGLDLSSLDVYRTSSQRTAEIAVKNALVHLTEAKLISILSVELAQILGSRAKLVVNWVDLLSGQKQQSIVT